MAIRKENWCFDSFLPVFPDPSYALVPVLLNYRVPRQNSPGAWGYPWNTETDSSSYHWNRMTLRDLLSHASDANAWHDKGSNQEVVNLFFRTIFLTAIIKLVQTQFVYVRLTFELCRLVSRVVLMRESWQSNQPMYWEDSSCSVQSSTVHTNLNTS